MGAMPILFMTATVWEVRLVSLRFICFTLLTLAGISPAAWGVSFIPAPAEDGPFSRFLWTTLPTVVDSGGIRIRYLSYSFGPANKEIPGGHGIKSIPFATVADQDSVEAAAATWTNASFKNAKNGNVLATDKNTYDLQSTALHELGHALGLDHPNYADREPPGLSRRSPAHTLGVNNKDQLTAGEDKTWGTDDDVAYGPGPDKKWGTADDVDDQLLNLSTGNPYEATKGGIVDLVNLNLSAMVPTREQAVRWIDPRLPNQTEAVMVQRAFPGETQRSLGYDDVQGLLALESGPDFLSRDEKTREDDFQYRFQLDQSGAKTPITIYNADLKGAGLTSGIWTAGETIALDGAFDDVGHLTTLLGFAHIFYDKKVTTVMCGDPYCDETRVHYYRTIDHVDIYLDTEAHVPEPGTFPLLGAGLGAIGLAAWRRRK